MLKLTFLRNRSLVNKHELPYILIYCGSKGLLQNKIVLPNNKINFKNPDLFIEQDITNKHKTQFT